MIQYKLSKMLSLFNTYKWYIAAIGLLAYSVFVWNIAGDAQENSYNKERLAHAQEVIKVQQENLELSKQLSQSQRKLLEESAADNLALTKGLIDEIAKDPRFKSCRTTDGVRSALQRKIDRQAR